MTLFRRTLLAGALAGLSHRARASRPLRVGVLTTLSGPAADGAGNGSVVAARMAAEARPDLAVEVLAADMGDRPDHGAGLARAWFDGGVHAVLDVPNSATALAVAAVARERNRVALFSGAGAATLTGTACGPNHLQWTYNTAALAAGAATALLQEGGKSWFFITADYAFGHALQRDVTTVVEAAGGRVLGSAAFANETMDFSAPLLQARASGAAVVGLACTGLPFETLVKQAAEFGIARGGQRPGGQRLASLLCLVTNVHAVGLHDAQGLLATEPFYWDFDPGARAFAAAIAPRNRGIMPTSVHAGVFSATVHLLRAVAAGADPGDGRAMVAAMKQLPAEDPLFGRSAISAQGSVAHPMHLFQVKSPEQSAGPWDVYRPLRTVPAEQAFRPAPGCALPG